MSTRQNTTHGNLIQVDNYESRVLMFVAVIGRFSIEGGRGKGGGGHAFLYVCDLVMAGVCCNKDHVH